MTGSYIKIGYFSLVGAFGEDAEPIEDLQYQDVVDGPLLLQVDRAIDLIFSHWGTPLENGNKFPMQLQLRFLRFSTAQPVTNG